MSPSQIKSFNKYRKRIYEIVEKGKEGDTPSIIFDWIIISLIIVSIASIILESFEDLDIKNTIDFYTIELITVVVFSIEYILRMMTSDFKYPDKKFPVAVIKNIFSFMLIIDLLAIMPFYLPLFITVDLRFLRILRLMRIFRVFKLYRYGKSLNLIVTVIRNEATNLIMMTFLVFLLLLISCAAMFYLEHEAQPEQFPDIISSFWWGVATLTTVGYGDVFPVTMWGKILTSIITLLGIGIIALPTGIISAGFLDEMQKEKKQNQDYLDEIDRLYELRQKRAITQEEYDKKKQSLLS